MISATKDSVPITVACRPVKCAQLVPSSRRSAASMNGEGEVVVSVAMMLIGENSRRLSPEAVKDKLQTNRSQHALLGCCVERPAP